jgi:predicted RNA binding protein YcfA (HicA-like mRNA interferase family)
MHTMKIRKLMKLLESDGWFLHREKGSHRQYRHPVKSGLVTIPGHPDDDVNPGTLASILKQAGLKSEGT